MPINIKDCIEKGTIGSLGAIPGTVCAHPLDLIKIRMQTTTSTTTVAVRQTWNQGPFRGVSWGVSQKVMTRGPMFFASEVSTQACQHMTGLSRDKALFVGSFASGYVTGFLAAAFEWAKVQTGCGSDGGRFARRSAGAYQLVLSRLQKGDASSVWRILRGAGLRNAVFDSTFFGVEHWLRDSFGLPHAVSFAAAAALALTVDYPLDVAVKRSMVKASSEPVLHGPVLSTWHFVVNDCRGRPSRIYRGLGCKAAEFSTSYFVTGAFAPMVIKGFGIITVALSSTVLLERSGY